MHSDGKKRRFALLFAAGDLQRWRTKLNADTDLDNATVRENSDEIRHSKCPPGNPMYFGVHSGISGMVDTQCQQLRVLPLEVQSF